MFELSLKGEIASAHYLRGYQGKCRNLHGHTWKVEVFMQKAQLNDLGMVEDFVVLKKPFRALLEELDHTCLNDLTYFQTVNPSAENIAKYIHDRFAVMVAPLTVTRTRVWESDIASATYWPDE